MSKKFKVTLKIGRSFLKKPRGEQVYEANDEKVTKLTRSCLLSKSFKKTDKHFREFGSYI
jgi:hypothetical protein